MIKWTADNLDTLRRLSADGKSGSQIALALGPRFSKNAVNEKIKRLFAGPIPESPWTAEREETLRRLWADGKTSATKIGEAIGMTKGAVVSKIHRLGLGRKTAAEISAAKRAGQLAAAAAKKAKSEAQRVKSEQAVAARAMPIALDKLEARSRGPVYGDHSKAPNRQPPMLALVSSVRLPERADEPPFDPYAHLRSDRGYHDALAALSRPAQHEGNR